MSIGFHRDCGRRQRELTDNKIEKGTFQLRILLKVKDIFEFADYQEKATYGFGCKLTLTGNVDNAVLNKVTQQTLVKLKFIVLIGLYRLIQVVF